MIAIYTHIWRGRTKFFWQICACRAPRLAPQSAMARTGKASDLSNEPWAVECRDWVRSKTIGKTLRCFVDYEKYQQAGSATKDPASTATTPGTPADKALNLRLYATIKLLNGLHVSPTSLSMALVGEGLATCFKYRNKDEPRSSEYDALVIEEATAAVKNKGMHSSNAPAEQKATDYSTDGW
jgi:hypothetical protein